MSYLINNQQKINDIIFANRNKNYGAYVLRSSYGNTLLKSIIIVMSGFGSVMGTAYYLVNKKAGADVDRSQVITETYKTTTVKLEEPRESKPKKSTVAASAPEGKKTDVGAALVVDSTSIEKPAVINSDINPNAVAQGTASASMPAAGEGGGNDDGKGEKKPGSGDGEIADPFGVDSQPEYEGGLGALYRFVAQNVKYPAMASDIGKEGTVYVKFVVDEKGKIGNLKLLNNAGFGFDDEALRVISLIPNFKTPAKVNGHPVKVYYQLPIKFRLR